MKISQEISEGNVITVIDGSGNFVISKNKCSIVGKDIEHMTICNWKFFMLTTEESKNDAVQELIRWMEET
jgi:hypothetical protein